jgi:HEAT repeat protein
LLRDPEQLVRLAAINALGRIGGPRAQQALEALIAGSDEVEAFAAEEALEEMTFYASVDAASIPIYEEVDTDEIDEDREDWFDEDEGEDDEDDDLGEYA